MPVEILTGYWSSVATSKEMFFNTQSTMMGITGLQSYRSALNPRSDLNREVELGAHGLVYLLLQVPTAGLSDSV